jgi:hypothetical protein
VHSGCVPCEVLLNSLQDAASSLQEALLRMSAVVAPEIRTRLMRPWLKVKACVWNASRSGGRWNATKRSTFHLKQRIRPYPPTRYSAHSPWGPFRFLSRLFT